LVLAGAAACTAFDVMHILRKARQPVADCVVEADAERAHTEPRVFTHIHLRYAIAGRGLDAHQVERAVKLSKDKYCSATIMLGTAGLALSVHAAGGLVSRLGFFVLALITVGSACTGYWSIRHGNIERHREWMTRSYACIFGAVTLRLWLPLLIVANGGEFLPAYRWVAWLAWVPNLAFAEWTIRRARARRGAPLVEQGSAR